MRPNKLGLLSTNKLVLMAFFIAIEIILTRFLSFYVPFLGGNNLRVGFGHVAIMLAGILLGPIAGAIVGALGDFIGTTLFSPFPPFPGFTVTAALTGFIPGFIFLYLKKGKVTFLKTLGTVYASEIIVSMLLNTLWLSMLYGTPYKALLFPRIISTSLLTIAYTILVYHLYKRLIKFKSLDETIQ